jgi:hypothetical protein
MGDGPVYASNHAGGILGGISTGQDVVVRFAVKPTSSILTPRARSPRGEETEIVTKGRHDPCVGIRAVPVGEAMMACVMLDHLLLDRGADRRRAERTPKPKDDHSEIEPHHGAHDVGKVCRIDCNAEDRVEAGCGSGAIAKRNRHQTGGTEDKKETRLHPIGLCSPVPPNARARQGEPAP